MNTTGQTSEGREKLVNDLKTVIKDAEEMLRNTSQEMDSRYQSARARFESTLQNARSNLNSAQQHASISSKEAYETTNRYVQENPWQSVGIGAAAGLLIGYLLSRK